MKASRAQARMNRALEVDIPSRFDTQDKQLAALHRKVNKLLKILNTEQAEQPEVSETEETE